MLEVRNLTKRYGDLTAVDGVSFAVARGEIFGFLGPNGAGKTTTLEMIEGLRRPDGGEILIKGQAVWPNPDRTKGLIGVQLQATAFYEELTVKETLKLFAALYGRRLSRSELESLLERVGLTEKANALTRSLSGGQKQRLAIVTTLANNPEIIFLDEPSTGLDPQARRRIWDVVRQLKQEGITVVLTTHFMEEAEVLCERVAIMDEGRIKAIDRPAVLIDALGSETKIMFSAEGVSDPAWLRGLGFESANGPDDRERYSVYSSQPGADIGLLLKTAADDGVDLKDLLVSTATLEDVFLSLTGKELRD